MKLFRSSVFLLIPAALVSLAQALTVRPPTFPELVARAETIVRAEVTGRRCEWQDSPQGRVIVTFITLRVESTLKGVPAAEMTLRQLGGEVGNQRLEVPGLPQFQSGDRDYLFIQGNGRQFCPLVAAPHGRYPVVRDLASATDYVARSDGAPLTKVEEVARPLGETAPPTPLERLKQAPMKAADFENAIRQEISRQAGGGVQPR
jgi:hypothetical protein